MNGPCTFENNVNSVVVAQVFCKHQLDQIGL